MRGARFGALALAITSSIACSQSNDLGLPVATPNSSGGNGGSAGGGSAGTAAANGGNAGSVTAGSSGTAGSGVTGGSSGSGGSSSSGGNGGTDSTAGAGGNTAGTGGIGNVVDAGGSGGAVFGDGSVAPPLDSGTTEQDSGLPAGAVVLFDGTNLKEWRMLPLDASGNIQPAAWKLIPESKAFEVVPTQNHDNMITYKKFNDVFVHLEYMTPKISSAIKLDPTQVQERGNSGVYLRMSYEMQILETHDLQPLQDGCGAVYKVAAPLVVACYDELIWNTYEIEFKASKWSGKNKTADAVFTKVTLNGKVVQNNTPVPVLNTYAGQVDTPGPQPIMLQDHKHPVQFRNIWVIPRN